jgi:hypothetical protein
VNVRTSGAGHFIHWIGAGDGGNGGVGAGAGGSVIGIKTNGDIGNFLNTFGLSLSATVQGGISTGKGGTTAGPSGANGSIFNVTAARIATMIAGRPAANAINSGNAVNRIAGIHAGVIGADTGIAGDHQIPGGPAGSTFDFNEGGANATFDVTTLDGDTAIDGLVFVVSGRGGQTLPVKPLLLLEAV